ncbi:hypothetical protein FXV77_07740 [Sphingobacterium phlebotomi]|uniref:HEPN domain-containing protein n=1 Tax=Sphingobacterium phlebotomi TaxID=2605433 RepID=A0A5D4H8A3_9SPHI|nr:hypothetical protein [Sphingobacterium phlebotomi]TYR37056.1 hypothetical protein FXV77_07740 [Sphingobacterium phlebotomi]
MVIDKQLLVERLVQRMDLDRIFLFSYSFLGNDHQHLILVMKPEDGVSPKVMKPVIELCLIDMDNLSFELIPFGEWRNKVRHGGLYYAYASLPKHEIYRSPRKATKSLTANEIGGVIELADQWQIKMKKEGEEFREGALKFAEHGNYLKATFMVHQSLESFLRLPQAMIQGNANNQHNLENRMRTLSNHIPAFKKVLLSEVFIDIETFRLLDKGYHAVKQNRDLEITAFDASYLYDKCCEISKAIEILYQFFLDALKTEQQVRLEQAAQQAQIAEEKKKVKPAIANVDGTTHIRSEDFSSFPWLQQYKDDVHAILDKIRSNHNPEQISLLNYHTGGFSGSSPFRLETNEERAGVKVELYLVVLMKNTGPFTFKTMQMGVASAMVVFLDLQYVERGLAEGNRFMHMVWTKGSVLRRKSTFEPAFDLGDIDWQQEGERADKLWKRGKTVMDNLVSTARDAQPLFADTGLLLLRNILEIGANSILRVAVGYIPKTKNLDELLDWTRVVGGQVVDYLLDESGLRGQMLHLMLHPKTLWWNPDLLDSLEEITPDFYRLQAEKLADLFDRLCFDAIEKIKKQAISATELDSLLPSAMEAAQDNG